MSAANSPLRLLRDNWRSPGDLARGLYEMLSSRDPIVREGPVEVQVKANQTGVRIVQRRIADVTPGTPGPRAKATPAGSSFTPGPAGLRGRARAEAARITPTFYPEPEPLSGLGGQHESPAFSVDGPAFFEGAPVQFAQPPQVLDPETGKYRQLDFLPDYDGPPQQSTGPFYGQVQGAGSGGGTGAAWSCLIYTSGPSSSGDSLVTEDVQILNVDPSEDAPTGLWITGILYYPPAAGDSGDGTFIATVPTWIDSLPTGGGS